MNILFTLSVILLLHMIFRTMYFSNTVIRQNGLFRTYCSLRAESRFCLYFDKIHDELKTWTEICGAKTCNSDQNCK